MLKKIPTALNELFALRTIEEIRAMPRTTLALRIGLSATLLLALALNSGCEGAPDEVACDDPADPVDPVDPQPYGCTVGEVEDWGDGMTPSIAGSDEGYAVVYPEWFDQSGMVRMVAPDGEPTSPVQNLPISQYDNWAQVTHGRNGYLVNGADAGTYGGVDLRTIYMMDQSGTVTRTYGPIGGLWNWGVSGGKTLDWTVTTAESTPGNWCPSGKIANAAAFGPAGTYAASAPYLCLYEEGFGSTSLTLGFAARGNGFALGLTHMLDIGSEYDPYAMRMRLQVAVYDDGAYRKVTLTEAQGHVGLSISRIVAADEGYVVRWSRYVFDYSGSGQSESEGYLTFLDPRGQLVRTVRTARPYGDIAWNGREIGEITYEDLEQTMILSRYGMDGVLIEETPVAVTSVHYMSMPKIASAAGGFALVWADNDYVVNDRPHLKFASVLCE